MKLNATARKTFFIDRNSFQALDCLANMNPFVSALRRFYECAKTFLLVRFIAVQRLNFMGKILSLALALSIISYTTPLSLLAAPEVVIGYANISARVSPLWIAQETRVALSITFTAPMA